MYENFLEIVLPILLLGLTAHFCSLAGSSFTFFEQQVPPGLRESAWARALLKKYLTKIWLYTALTLAALFLLGTDEVIVGLVASAWQGARSGLSWWDAHVDTRIHLRETGVKFAEPVSKRSWIWESSLVRMGPYILFVVAAMYLAHHWQRLPDPYPILWNAEGARAFQAKSVWVVYRPLLAGVLTCGLLSFVDFLKRRQGTLPRGSGEKVEPKTRHSTAFSLVLQYFLSFVTLWIAVIYPLPLGLPEPARLFHFFLYLAIAHIVFFAMKHGLSGLDYEWASRPGFDEPPVQPLDLNRPPPKRVKTDRR